MTGFKLDLGNSFSGSFIIVKSMKLNNINNKLFQNTLDSLKLHCGNF